MKKTIITLLAAGALAASMGAPAVQARGFGHGGFRGHGGFHRGYGGFHRGYGNRGIGTGAAVGLGLLGAGIAGAAIAGSQGYGGYPAYSYGGAYPSYPYGGGYGAFGY